MSTCPSCSAEVPAQGRFCPACGSSLLDASATPTVAAPGAGRTPPAPGTSPAPPAGSVRSGSAGVPHISRSGAEGHARFIPGAVLAGRYRIVGLLGKGGMGEVYRADDLKLGQPVALKLLPEALGASESFLERFYGEVRIARQVSHPNVCRVYDVGEVDGLHYISMEYIDGEDLGSLLRRIGRLPGDKAVEISRQICAGLAAAHDRGVLHRDLKPANVMIDGRGHARIADFGLAGVADEIRGKEIRSGTPAYMAPEQLAGREVSVRSDIYALGLVLYELFTGRRAFEAESLDQLRSLHESSTVTSPASHVQDLDPVVERVILRCLDKDPSQRPQTALAVAAALPGGDPLAAALAAGETPSPEMVAAAGDEGALSPVAAWSLFAATVAGLALAALLNGSVSFYSHAPVEKPPQVLADRARTLLEGLGHETPPADTAFGYRYDVDYVGWLAGQEGPARWERLETGRPAGVFFWYRESPRSLVPYNGIGTVSWRDPPETVSGMVSVATDTAGRLIALHVVPPQVEEAGEGVDAPAPDWAPLFGAAGLDPADFTPAGPEWTPPAYADARAAWTGAYPELPGVEVRLEAAAYRGTPIYFASLGPWSRPARMQAFSPGMGQVVGQALFILFFVSMIIAAAILARRNLRFGRGDRKGAFRVGLYICLGNFTVESLQASHVASMGDEFSMMVRIMGGSLFVGGFVWLLYLAIEPLVRRSWPEGIISWSRLLAGRFRDPLVGRHVLIGCGAGVGMVILERLYHLLPPVLGLAAPSPHYESRFALLGVGQALSILLQQHFQTIWFAMILMFFFYLGAIRGRNLIGAGIFFAIYLLMDTLFRGAPWESGIALGVVNALIVTALYYRFGLLAATAALLFESYNGPLTLDFGRWYAGQVLVPVLALAALAGVAAWIAQARSPAPARAGARAGARA